MNIKGLEGVRHVLEDVTPRNAKNLMRATIHGVAKEVRDEIRENAPTDGAPYTLRPAIKHKRQRGTRDKVGSAVTIDKKAFFWRFLEWGTVEIAERKFILRAVESVTPRLQAIFVQTFGNRLEASIKRALKRQR